MKILSSLALAAALTVAGGTTLAHDYTVGGLKIGHPWSRAMPNGAPVAGGFLTITNTGAAPDRLVAATSEAAAKVEIHEMAVIDGIMKMRPLDAGLAVPAGATVELKPGSYHIMFIGPKKPFAKGDMVKGALTFEKAGAVEVEFQVEEMAAKAMDHGAMKH